MYPPTLKSVAREIIPGQLVDWPDPTHSRVSKHLSPSCSAVNPSLVCFTDSDCITFHCIEISTYKEA